MIEPDSFYDDRDECELCGNTLQESEMSTGIFASVCKACEDEEVEA